MDRSTTTPAGSAAADGGARAAGDEQHVRQRVSALIDGDCELQGSAPESLGAVARDPRARRAWLEYHQVGDWLRSSQWDAGFDDAAFLERFGQRLRAEPVQWVPDVAREARAARSRLLPWAAGFGAALAGVVAVVLVGLGGAAPEQFTAWRLQVAAGASPRAVALARAPAASQAPGGAIATLSLRASALKATLRPGNGVPLGAALLGTATCEQPLHGRAVPRVRVVH
jgi:negative regulator of sigma E activity